MASTIDTNHIDGNAVYLGVNTGTLNSKSFTAILEEGVLQLNIKGEQLDVTNKNSEGWKQRVYGAKDWSGSVNGMFHTSDTTFKQVLDDIITHGTSTWIQINKINGVSISAQGPCLWDLGMTYDSGDICKWTGTFTGAGKLSFSNLA
jgi:predicted secreted protein